MIDDAEVDRIRQHADIARIIGQYVALIPVGQNLEGVCPFHDVPRGRLFVHTEKRFYLCDQCGQCGDVFRFLSVYLGIEWKDAVRAVSSRPPEGFRVDAKTYAEGL